MSALAAWQGFISDIARPVAVLTTSTAAAWATILVAGKVENGNDGALFMGAVFTGLGVIYTAKSVEVWKKHAATASASASVGVEKTADLAPADRIDPKTGF